MANGSSQWSAADLAARARRIAREVLEPRAADVDRAQAFPFDNVAVLSAAGFMGMTLPPELGGWQVTLHGALAVIEQVAQACATSARIVADLNLGTPVAVIRHAHEGALRQITGRIVAGQRPTLCIEDAASVAVDPAGNGARPRVTVAHARGRQFVINGVKQAVEGAGVSDAYVVVAELHDVAGVARGRGAFLALRSETDGIEVLNPRATLGTRGLPLADVVLRDVVVPARNMLYVLDVNGKPGSASAANGDDAPDLVSRVLSLENNALGDAAHGYELALAAISVGIATGALRASMQVGLPRAVVAELGVRIQAARSLLFGAASSGVPTSEAGARESAASAAYTALDDEIAAEQESLYAALLPDPTMAARARLFASSESIAICNRCIDAVGARALTRELPLERQLRDVRTVAASGRSARLLTDIAADELLDRRPTTERLRRMAEARRALRDELTVLPPPRQVPIPK